MEQGDVQITFFKKVNEWLSKLTNQKKYAITDFDTNPKEDKLCIYILGGWAVNRYYFFRETNDVDLIGNVHQIKNLLKDLDSTREFIPVSSPDNTKLYTQKWTLKNSSNQQFSFEARLFESSNKITFGNLELNREWFFEDSINFNDRTVGLLAYVRVPSKIKLIVLKCFSVVGRPENDSKIKADFIDIITLSRDNTDSENDKVLKELTELKFQLNLTKYKSRLDKVIEEIELPHNTNDENLVIKILNLNLEELYQNKTHEERINIIQPAELLIKRQDLLNIENNLRWNQISNYIQDELTIIGWSCNSIFRNQTNTHFEQMLNNGIKINIIIQSPDSISKSPNLNFGPVCNHSRNPERILEDIEHGISTFEKFYRKLNSVSQNNLKLFTTNYLITWSCVSIDRTLESGKIQVEFYHYDNPTGNHLDDRLNLILSHDSEFYLGFSNSIANILKVSKSIY